VNAHTRPGAKSALLTDQPRSSASIFTVRGFTRSSSVLDWTS
jgi:hypothetical protein